MSQVQQRRFPSLKRNQQSGSKPRCHLLTDGTKEQVAKRLTELISPWGIVTASDSWMPEGFAHPAEAQLHLASSIIADKGFRNRLSDWWLAIPGNGRTTTPNWDIASTCSINEKPGILLIEAKSHDAELRNEERGKSLKGEDNKGVSIDSQRNHVRIGACIQDASLALAAETKLPWALSRDWNYQMANRFAWAWKVAEIGVPVILVYLGFTECEEMRKGKTGQRPFASADDWQQMVEDHSRTLFPREVWNKQWTVSGQSFIPLIRSSNQPLVVPAP